MDNAFLISFTGVKDNGDTVYAEVDPLLQLLPLLPGIPIRGYPADFPLGPLNAADFGSDFTDLISLSIQLDWGSGGVEICNRFSIQIWQEYLGPYCRDYPNFIPSEDEPFVIDTSHIDAGDRGSNYEVLLDWESITINDITLVPVPATLPLLVTLVGLGGFLGAWRRRTGKGGNPDKCQAG